MVGVVGFVVAFGAAWVPSLWTDEAATISAAGRTLPELVRMAHTVDAVHATYYAVMHVWLQVTPATAGWLRLPSAVAVGLTTAGLFTLADRLGGARLAWFAALVFVVLPRTTWSGTEARSYALSALLVVLATLVLVGATEQPGRSRLGRWWPVAYAVLVAAGVAVNLYTGLVVVGHAVSLLLRPVPWRRRAVWAGAAAAGAVLSAPVTWVTLHQSGQLGDSGLTPFGWVRNVVVNQWFLGETPTTTTGASVQGDLGWKVAALALAAVGWLLVLAGLALGRRREDRALLAWALPWVVVPTAAIGAYALGVRDVYNPRYLTLSTAGLALLVAHGVLVCGRALGGRRVGERQPARRAIAPAFVVTVLAVLAVLSAPVYVSQRMTYAKSSSDWSAVAAFVAAHRQAGSGVYFAPRFAVTGDTVGQTTRGVAVAYPAAFAGMTDVTLLRTPVQEGNLTGTSRVLADAGPALGEVQHLWTIRRQGDATRVGDEAFLASQGFRPGLSWTGPLDVVTRYDRG